jgi:hypothetical protein
MNRPCRGYLINLRDFFFGPLDFSGGARILLKPKRGASERSVALAILALIYEIMSRILMK